MDKKLAVKQKLAILEKGADGFTPKVDLKNRTKRQEFWSFMMETAERDTDRLKASELLGRSEADFTDKHQFGGDGGNPINIQPMNLKGLNDAINRLEGK